MIPKSFLSKSLETYSPPIPKRYLPEVSPIDREDSIPLVFLVSKVLLRFALPERLKVFCVVFRSKINPVTLASL